MNESVGFGMSLALISIISREIPKPRHSVFLSVADVIDVTDLSVTSTGV